MVTHQSNKITILIISATEYHLGTLKAKLAKYRGQLLEPTGKKGEKGEGFDVLKSGDARVAMIGFPSVGKVYWVIVYIYDCNLFKIGMAFVFSLLSWLTWSVSSRWVDGNVLFNNVGGWSFCKIFEGYLKTFKRDWYIIQGDTVQKATIPNRALFRVCSILLVIENDVSLANRKGFSSAPGRG